MEFNYKISENKKEIPEWVQQRIDCIKYIRKISGLGLSESKHLLDNNFPSGQLIDPVRFAEFIRWIP